METESTAEFKALYEQRQAVERDGTPNRRGSSMEIILLFHGSGGDYSGWERTIYWFVLIGIPVGGVALLIYAGNLWNKRRHRKD